MKESFFPCRRYRATPLNRREMLAQCAGGFGAVALAALRSDPAFGAELTNEPTRGVARHGPHHAPKAKNIIFLYMDGGPSQVDTFDPKPALTKYDGQDPGAFFEVEPTQFNNNGKVLASPWKFKQHGQSGIPISSLFPHLAECADELAIVRSMVSEFPEHTFANYFLHTGSGFQGRPSMGAWVNYGLGSECQNLPGFVVLNGGLIPPGGLDCFGSGFLPASYQGSIFKPSGSGVANIRPTVGTPMQQRRKLDLIGQLDGMSEEQFGRHDELESAIRNYELAYQMQMAVPEVMEIKQEPKHIQQMYGLEAEYRPTQIYGAQCLLARRMVDRGVRFIELTCPSVAKDRWDQHSDLKGGHENNAKAVDQPVAALLKDLRQRGLLDETLVVWAGEFGRTPFAQGKNGRDHNPHGFSIWLAGGGVKGGTIYGATDEWGYKAIENRTEIHDLHATMLHLLGVDHTKSTFRFGGRDMRLTDVKGHLIHDILA
ncbi:Sulfatase [Planctomycetales bacterium 10988]|nr:Sulfatase [Planctomycetales bacterium 10988]